MTNTFKKIAAIFIILISAISLVFSLVVIIQVWRVQPGLTEKLVNGLTLMSSILDTTDEGLALLDETLSHASSSVEALAKTTQTLAENISNTSTTVQAFSALFIENIPDTLINTEGAIEAAQSSAAVIDGVLSGLASIPLIGIDYNPEKSLSTTLGQVADSLATLPNTIEGIGSDLGATSASLTTLQEDIEQISANVLSISQNLEEAQAVVNQYQDSVNQLQSWTEMAIEQAPTWIRISAICVIFVILWLMVAQVSLLMQGVNLFKFTR